MEKRTISFSPPDISGNEIEYVTEVLKSGWITTGPKTKLFEKKLAEYIGCNKVVCLNSQTTCAEMALRLLGIGEGDEVITSAYTYTASASIIAHVGAKVVLVDCCKDSLDLDYDAVAEAINERTKAIIPIDIAGVPCDYKKLFDIAESKKDLYRVNENTTELGQRFQKALGRVAIVEDAAHALGASWKGRNVGSFADFSAFSFHAVKNLTTAEGGCLSWRAPEGIDDEEIYHQVQLLSLHGQSKDALTKNKAGAWEYDIEGLWYKCNMTDIMAAFGLAQLERYPEMLRRRKEIVKKYDAAFQPLGIEVLPHYADGNESSGHLYLTRVLMPAMENFEQSGNPVRNEIIEKMAEAGIACNVHYKPLPMMTGYKKLGFDIINYPNAYHRYQNEITLPLHTSLSDEDVDYIIENFCRIVKEYL
ncbi:MAG: DegT/DnrJ/EryC1/StrS family aminotransferase [Lachnospiraceae bacterium]|nr:DegT/DnrJ/EryC1/StrS family aminotransferase [Lachnospiraceae bacterium]